MIIDDSIKRIFDKLDDELLDLAILINANPEKKDEILNNWVQDKVLTVHYPYVYVHDLCKQDPAGLCRQVDDSDQETFGDLDGLFKMVPCLHRFRKDML
jgi:hypothetical protein